MAVLSNTWGRSVFHPEVLEMFDAAVLSEREGLRKPEPEIYARALPPAIGGPPFNDVESHEVSLLLTGRRRCLGSVACALMPTCFNVERGCRSRNVRAAANTTFFSSVVQKIRSLPGIDSPWRMLLV